MHAVRVCSIPALPEVSMLVSTVDSPLDLSNFICWNRTVDLRSRPHLVRNSGPYLGWFCAGGNEWSLLCRGTSEAGHMIHLYLTLEFKRALTSGLDNSSLSSSDSESKSSNELRAAKQNTSEGYIFTTDACLIAC